MDAAQHLPIAIPCWSDLCQKALESASDPQMAERMLALKERERSLVYKTARQIVSHLLPGVCYQKFLEFNWSEVVELMADQALRNREIMTAIESDPARRASMAPVTGKFDSRVFRPHSQLPCTRETAQQRVQKALSLLGHDAKILLLGDDDLVSVELAEAGFRNITVVDIDRKIIGAIRKACDTGGHDISLAVHDLRRPAPRDLIGDYDLVFFDPEYSLAGLELFFSAALNFTGGRPGTLFFVSIHLMSLRPSGLQEAGNFLEQAGIKLLEFHQGFNVYPVPARLRALIRLVNQFVVGTPELSAAGWTLPYFLSDALLLQKT